MNNIIKFLLMIFIGCSLFGCTVQQPVNNLHTEHPKTVQQPVNNLYAGKPKIKTSDKIKAEFLNVMEKAKRGDVYSQYVLGILYAEGKYIPLDYQKAYYWLMKAAQKGHADAQRNLGFLYEYGRGVPKDYYQAVMWFRKAAEQGLPSAQVNLGYSYSHGEGVPQNFKEAAKWYKKAALHGDSMGQHNLARCYIDGEGVPQNFIYAYAWSSLAAAQGHENARINRDLLANRQLNSEQLIYAQELATELQYNIEHPSEKSQSYYPDVPATEESKLIGSGTGFIITKDGYIITCNHVISSANIIKVVIGNKIFLAKFIKGDSYNDLALIKISGIFPALALSSKRSVTMGQEVFTIGYPNPGIQGVNAKVTKGIINSLSGFQDDLRMYQISTPVQPGNSGGPLLDNYGNVIGVIVAMLNAKTVFQISGSLPQNVNYAVKGAYALRLLNKLQIVGNIFPHPSSKQNFEKAVIMAQKSIVMVLTYE